MHYLSRIIIVSIITFSLSSLYVVGEVDEQSLFARYSFEVYNTDTNVYDLQNNAERLIETGNPQIGYTTIMGIGNYYDFDGDDSLVDATTNGIIADGAFSQNVPQLAICTVVKPDYDAVTSYFVVSEYGRDGYFFDWRSGNNATYMWLRNSTGHIQARWSPIRTNTTGWTLLTYAYSSGNNGFMRIWHNATIVLNFTGKVLIPQIENRFAIMRQQWNGYYSEGKVGFLEIYTTPVNDRWVSGKYNDTFGIEWYPSSGGVPATPPNNAWIIGFIIAIPIVVIALKRGRR